MKEKVYPTVALGTWAWGTGVAGGDQVFGNSLTGDQLKPVFDAAMEAGLNLWDTATVYGMGASEDILGGFVREYPREDLILSTKFTPQIADAASTNSVEKMLNASLERFGTDYVDIYWIHNPADVELWTPGLIPCLKSGKVKSVGVSNHNLAELKRAEEILSAEGFHVSAVQNHYSLLYRSSEKAGILDYCKENGMTFFAYMVLEQGALSGKYDTEHPLPEGSARGETYNGQLPQIEKLVKVMRAVGEEHSASVAQVAIAWAVAKGVLPLVGATKPRHVAEAAAASRIKLTDEEMRLIEETAANTEADTRGSWEHPME